jgi:predicted nucleotidyltransferase
MTRDRVLRLLKLHEREIRARGARSIYLFGSVSRDEARRGSDIDLFIDYYRNRKFSLLDLVGLKRYLESLLRSNVDLVTRGGLHRMLRGRIEAEAIKIF